MALFEHELDGLPVEFRYPVLSQLLVAYDHIDVIKRHYLRHGGLAELGVVRYEVFFLGVLQHEVSDASFDLA